MTDLLASRFWFALVRLLSALALLALAAGASGCRCPVPGDGRLVLVTLDERVASHLVGVVAGDHGEVEPLGDFVAEGARYWDAVGARLRTYGQLTDAEWAEAPTARTIHVEPTSGFEHSLDDSIAFYSDVDGFVRVDLSSKTFDPGFGFFRRADLDSIFAHELGHALGLDHEPACSGVMSPGCSVSALSPSDVAQFRALWPSRRSAEVLP